MQVALLCDDRLQLDGFACLLAGMPDCQIVASGESWSLLEGRLKKGRVDALIIFSSGISMQLADAIGKARKRLGITLICDERVTALNADIQLNRNRGFEGLQQALLKASQIQSRGSSAVREAVALYGVKGDLTPREREVARLVSQGMPNRRIAASLGIQEQSVKNLVSAVMRKLRCENRVQLALHLSSARH